MENNRTKTDLIILALISAVLILWGLGSGSLTSWDEGMYAGVSRQILLTGDWINLRWAGLPWSDKPPLYMWMTVISFMAFGVNEFAVRFFSALCGIGTVLVIYLLGRTLYSRRAAIASALVLLTTWHFFWSSRVGMLDMPFTFFLSLSLLTFKLGEKRNFWLLFSPIAFSLAFLTKSMASASLAVMLAVYIPLAGDIKLLKDRYLIAGSLLAMVILGAWHLAAFSGYGKDFVMDYFVKHLLTRTTTSVEGHTGDLLTYFGVIPNKGRPWSMIGLALIPYMAWRVWKRGEKEHLIPVIWASAVIGLFSVVKTKLHWYIMPVYPALALMTGWALAKILKRYTVAAVIILAAACTVYLAFEKNIFNLDYSPRIKSIALQTRAALSPGEKVFLYDISDPDLQFYLGDVSENIRGEGNLRHILDQKGTTLLTTRAASNAVNSAPGPDRTTVLEDPDFMLLKTQAD